MEVLDLNYELSCMRQRGVNLTLDEKMQLELALHSLHTKIECDELLFWGKINGINKDYFMAVAVTYTGKFEFPDKKFYWCLSDDYNFKETPDLNDAHREFVDKDVLFFMGEPNKKLKQPAEGEE